ncbi:hypothetical protein Poly24_45410 [Rosistilla carotiformis]|uniref:DUF4013 domain-containing protein n=1 Tax=Rosistilla carotiformis TaxID=2528017 RepID=A0A518JZ42_9BACT|nr:DUF4013 domain-containing protein [Rosistilla carotiformis]QDV70809.1 hypothetical protein Poly24_45410 [Rosistilla carotiformis]
MSPAWRLKTERCVGGTLQPPLEGPFDMLIDAERVPGATPPAILDVPLQDIGWNLDANPSGSRWKSIASGALKWGVVRPFQTASLIILLALLSALPVLQLIALGYLLEVSGRVARSGRLRDGLFLLDQAGRIGIAVVAILILTLPIRLVATWAQAAQWVDPGGRAAAVLPVFGTALVILIAAHLGWVWFRGGRLRSYFWPRPIRFLKQVWRPATWIEARDRLWDFVASMQLGQLFWLGTRGILATLVWLLIPASILIGTTRDGQTGVAALVGIIGFISMAIVLLYLPFLQARFAAENRWRAMFEVRPIREAFRASPVFFWLGLTLTLLFAVPLYLLKIEATPQEVVWLPCIVMVAFMLPARLFTGLAVGRGQRRTPGATRWHKTLRIGVRLLCLPIIFGYLGIVFLSAFTSWDGLATWFQQHALLIPVPFNAGV